MEKQLQFETHLFLAFLSSVDFYVGTPPQFIKMQFEPGPYFNSILSKHTKYILKTDTPFDQELSSSYFLKHETSYLFAQNKIIAADLGIDTIQFNKTILPMTQFFIADNWGPEVNYSSIGLLISIRDGYVSFIDQLFIQGLIGKRQFSIETFNQAKGRLIIGEDPSLSLLSKAFDITAIPDHTRSTPHFLCLKLVYSSFKTEHTVKTNFEVAIDEAFGFVQYPEEMNETISHYFINKLQCEKVEYASPMKRMGKMQYAYYLCNKKGLGSIGGLPSIVFQFPQGNITLQGEELFIEYDKERMLFAIVYYQGGNQKFILGQPILKKYKAVHNFEFKTVSFYYKSINYSSNRVKRSLLIFITVGMIIGGIIIIIQLTQRKRY